VRLITQHAARRAADDLGLFDRRAVQEIPAAADDVAVVGGVAGREGANGRIGRDFRFGHQGSACVMGVGGAGGKLGPCERIKYRAIMPPPHGW